MARKRTLFSKLTGQYFFALTSAAVLISGLIAILLTGWNRRLIMAFLCIGFVMAAASLGYDVSVSDAERAAADDEELSLDELSSVAGGGLFDKCGVLWHCVMANM